MMTLVNLVLGLISGISGLFNRLLDMIRDKRLIEQGKTLERADQAIREVESLRAQEKILSEKRSKEEVIKTMEDGKF